ncbi:MAG TPA: TIGR03086 family metal-binding protein [Pseudonocardiaceae bacterium]|nr:TIGR03086 family metal-binding protein [Pseudonocardiaceae bacterium]
MPTTIVELDSRAVRASIAVVERVQLEELAAPTPCAQWTLGELLSHLTAQHRGFAAAAGGRGGETEVWRAPPPGPDPVADYRKAAEEVLAAFAEDGVLDRGFLLPEIVPDQPFPAEMAIGFHTVDYVVHTWDVARSIGVDVEFDQELLDVTGAIVARIPDGPERLAPGASFGPAVAVTEGSGELGTILAALGRSPRWPG